MGAAVPPPGAAPGVAAAGMTDNAASALCYVPILITGILFLVLAPYNQNKTIRFHAFQSIFLTIAWIVVSIVFSIVVELVFGVFGMYRVYYLTRLIWLLFIILFAYLGLSAYQGKTVVLPVIGPIAQGQA
jgi:uncharacterized membrane protein